VRIIMQNGMFRKVVITILVSFPLLLAACGGGGQGVENHTANNAPPSESEVCRAVEAGSCPVAEVAGVVLDRKQRRAFAGRLTPSPPNGEQLFLDAARAVWLDHGSFEQTHPSRWLESYVKLKGDVETTVSGGANERATALRRRLDEVPARKLPCNCAHGG
jgi:hypothetical protein